MTETTGTKKGLGLRASARELTRLGYAISHVGLLKAHTDGRVKRNDDGSFDVDSCLIALQQNSHPIRSHAARSQQQSATPAPEPEAPHRPEPMRTSLLDDSTPGIPIDGTSEPPLPAEGSIAEATRRLEWARVQREEARAARELGKLVELAPVNAFVAGMIIQARDEFLRIPMELRDALSHESDPIKIDKILTSRIEDVLAKLSEYRGGEYRVAA